MVRSAMEKEQVKIGLAAAEFSISDLDNPEWQRAVPVSVSRYWSGKTADSGELFTAYLLWSALAIYVRFDANQAGSPLVSEEPTLDVKTIGLWERDVCELFIAPDARNRRRYFEFEIAPTGEWLDLIVDWMKDEPRDWEYASGMEPFARIEKDKVTMAMKIPWSAFGRRPNAGDVWLGNLFRCVGKDPTRGYLAWRPTLTENPNFHVPEKFGEFKFIK
jgi:hypothetical protein